jgi:RNA polymerase sigma factor (sigma-70 family)
VSEAEILKGCIENNRLAQKRLYEHFYGRMMGVCMRYASHKEQATEMLNMGFFKVFKTLESFAEKGGNLEAWIYRIMVNNAIDCLRAEARHQHSDIDSISYNYAEDHVNVIAELNAEQILEYVNQLPVSYRTVFNLYVMEGHNHREIGELLGISEGTSKSNLAKARMKLQKMINDNNTVKATAYGK